MQILAAVMVAVLCAAGPIGTACAAEPSRDDIGQKIAQAQAGRSAGITGIVIGGVAVVAGWVSFFNEVADEDERDQDGYAGCYSSYSCPEDEKEEPEYGGLVLGVVVGAGLIATGTVATVRNSRELNRLRRRQGRIELGYDPAAHAATVAWNF